MRDDELRQVDAAVSVEEEIEVEGPGAVWFADREPPSLRLEALEEPEQIERRQEGPAGGDGVHEVGLRWPTNGRREVEG